MVSYGKCKQDTCLPVYLLLLFFSTKVRVFLTWMNVLSAIFGSNGEKELDKSYRSSLIKE